MPYVSRAPLNEHERRVQAAGYPWVQTVQLRPAGAGNQFNERFLIFDKLDPHAHHSRNTHLIISGKLSIYQTHTRAGVDNNRRLFGVLDANNNNADEKEMPVWNHTQYEGEPGVAGATFVEGHTILSPDTAKRFEDRGVIFWVEDDTCMTRQQWLEKHRADRLREGIRTNWVNQAGLYGGKRT